MIRDKIKYNVGAKPKTNNEQTLTDRDKRIQDQFGTRFKRHESVSHEERVRKVSY